jgi:hypothetical protein
MNSQDTSHTIFSASKEGPERMSSLRIWLAFNAIFHFIQATMILFAPRSFLNAWGLPLVLTEPALMLLSFYGLLDFSIALFMTGAALLDERSSKPLLRVVFVSNFLALYLGVQYFSVASGPLYASTFFTAGFAYFLFL